MYEYLLPVGTVVLLNGGKKKLVITGVLPTKEEKVYDYTGVTYPEGDFAGCMHFLFNHADIENVIFRGYEDKERESFLNLLEILTKRRKGEKNKGE